MESKYRTREDPTPSSPDFLTSKPGIKEPQEIVWCEDTSWWFAKGWRTGILLMCIVEIQPQKDWLTMKTISPQKQLLAFCNGNFFLGFVCSDELLASSVPHWDSLLFYKERKKVLEAKYSCMKPFTFNWTMSSYTLSLCPVICGGTRWNPMGSLPLQWLPALHWFDPRDFRRLEVSSRICSAAN